VRRWRRLPRIAGGQPHRTLLKIMSHLGPCSRCSRPYCRIVYIARQPERESGISSGRLGDVRLTEKLGKLPICEGAEEKSRAFDFVPFPCFDSCVCMYIINSIEHDVAIKDLFITVIPLETFVIAIMRRWLPYIRQPSFLLRKAYITVVG